MLNTLESALDIAFQGFPVFPVKLCPDACLRCNICKNPASPHGFQDAVLDAEQICALWKQHPGQLIGVPTGEVSDVDVLDLDSAKHPEAIVWWMANRQRIPHTRTHQTGSGGLHIYFKHNALARTGNGRLGEGIDVKAAGGYVVWWPAFGRRIAHEGPISEGLIGSLPNNSRSCPRISIRDLPAPRAISSPLRSMSSHWSRAIVITGPSGHSVGHLRSSMTVPSASRRRCT